MADTNAKLEALGEQIRGEIDVLHSDDSAGATPPVVASEDGAGAGEEPPPPPPPPAAAPKPAAPEPKRAAEAPPVEQGPMSATGAELPATAPTAPAAPQVVSEADLLKDYSRDEIDALRKYAPGGKITSPEILKEARAKVAANYWENTRRLAEQARGAEPTSAATTPPADGEAPPQPPELARYDAPIQAVVTEAKRAIASITGWTTIRAQTIQEASTLQARRARGDSTVDPDEITEKWNYVHQIDGHIEGWQKHYQAQRGQFDDLLARRDEVKLLLDTRDRLDRQEREEGEKKQNVEVQNYYSEWSKHLKELAVEYKVPEARLAKLEKDARAATYFAATEAAIPDIRAFLNEFVKEFMDPITAAQQAGAASYNKVKADHAPKQPPAGGKSVPETPPADAPLSPHDALRSLERRVMSDDAWEKMGAAQ